MERDEKSTRFLCANTAHFDFTIETRSNQRRAARQAAHQNRQGDQQEPQEPPTDPQQEQEPPVPPVVPPPNPPPPAVPPPQVPPPPVVPVMAVAFTLSPGRNNNVLDYDNYQEAVKLYHKAIAPMEELFDGTPEKVHIFLANVADKACRYNWDAILTVMVAPNNYNLIMQYGQVASAQVQAYAATYIGTQTRNTQNSDMLYHFLMASLTSAFKGKVCCTVRNTL
ncbi:hypothetical protein ACA910_013588 [Epithemia clementina (nom. ined.)]